MSNDSQLFCGPDELLAKLLDGREVALRGNRAEVYGNISNEGAHHLVKLSYYASQSVEEGRYPRFRIYVPTASNPPPGCQDPWQLAKFSEPVPLREIDDLRRLAPCVATHDFALEVHEQMDADNKSEVVCIGIRLAH